MIIQTINHIKDADNLERLLYKLKKVGVSGIRINLSKIPPNEIVKKINDIYPILLKSNLEIYLDFPYPKGKARIRKTNFCDKSDFKFKISKGKKYIITTSLKIYNSFTNCILIDENTNLKAKCGDLKYYADGEGGFLVINEYTEYIEVEAVNSFEGYIGKSIHCGYIEFDRYLDDISRNLNYSDVNFIFSFVESSIELKILSKDIMGNIVPKIETKSAVEDIQNIVCESDKILIARGDLALDVPISEFFSSIEKIVRECKRANKKIIFCTDILSCSDGRLVPYRSEIFDLFLIKKLGCDYVVLPCTKEINLFTKGSIEYDNDKVLDTILDNLAKKINIINKIFL